MANHLRIILAVAVAALVAVSGGADEYCDAAAEGLIPCVDYLSGKTPNINNNQCCPAATRLSLKYLLREEHVKVCNCLKTLMPAAAAIKARADGLPSLCGFSLQFPVYPVADDCDKITS